MITGIAVAARAIAPKAHIIGIQTDVSPALRDSLRDDKCYQEYAHAPTICEGLAGGIGKMVFDAAKSGLIDDVVIVKEDDVRVAMRVLAETHQIIVEGSGAVGVAALLSHAAELRGRHVVVVLSGGNIDLEVFRTSIDFALIQPGGRSRLRSDTVGGSKTGNGRSSP
jgi:threonine dehydratase